MSCRHLRGFPAPYRAMPRVTDKGGPAVGAIYARQKRLAKRADGMRKVAAGGGEAVAYRRRSCWRYASNHAASEGQLQARRRAGEATGNARRLNPRERFAPARRAHTMAAQAVVPLCVRGCMARTPALYDANVRPEFT